MYSILIAQVVEGADMGVIQRGNGSRLALKTLLHIRARTEMGGQNLDRKCDQAACPARDRPRPCRRHQAAIEPRKNQV